MPIPQESKPVHGESTALQQPQAGTQSTAQPVAHGESLTATVMTSGFSATGSTLPANTPGYF